MHIHPYWEIIIACVVGQAISILKMADESIKSKAKPEITKLSQYFAWSWISILFRTAVEQGLFWTAVLHPDAVSAQIAKLGITWDASLPVGTPLGGFAFGLGSDYILHWLAPKVPVLGKFLGAEA